MAVRGNNPGNLEATPWTQSQAGYIGSRTSGTHHFAIFDTISNGIAAQTSLLGSYIRRGYNTVHDIIWRYGNDPGTQDDAAVNNYVSYVSSRLGVSPNTVINSSQSGSLGQAMREFETGARQSGVIAGGGNGQASGGVLDSIRNFERWTVNGVGGDGNWWTNPNNSLTELDPTGISGFLVSLANPSTWARFSIVFIGIILIGLAIAAFVLTSEHTSSIGKAIPSG